MQGNIRQAAAGGGVNPNLIMQVFPYFFVPYDDDLPDEPTAGTTLSFRAL